MRGRLASRAHSFKENLLNVFGSGNNQQQQQNSNDNPNYTSSVNTSSFPNNPQSKSIVQLEDPSSKRSAAARSSQRFQQHHGGGGGASNESKHAMAKKKTTSTDNIIEFVTTQSLSDPRAIENKVRDVDLALRYFQDAVAKGTYELLPGTYFDLHDHDIPLDITRTKL